MSEITHKTTVLEGYRLDTIPYADLMAKQQPVILKGAVSEWGLVKAGLDSAVQAMNYLKSFYNGKTVGTFIGPPEIKGRFFYNENITAMNFKVERLPLDAVLDDIQKHLADELPPTFYVGSTTVDACLPGLRLENDLVFNHPMFNNNDLLASIWIGGPSVASAHYDMPNNIACCAVGRRRFTLFPPDQIENLYPGPLDLNPGGQVISMVDFNCPDFDKYPKFRDAIAAGQIADLEPGDLLFYPSMWWHQVEATAPFNVMINYWWNTSPEFMGTPMNVLYHALLSIRDRPDYEKKAWQKVFDYYIFGDTNLATRHLPEQAHGQLSPIDDLAARKLRAYLINRLNR
jgi:hypothetical protein